MQGSMRIETHSEIHPWANFIHNGVSFLPEPDKMPLKATEIIAMYAASNGDIMPGLDLNFDYGLSDNE